MGSVDCIFCKIVKGEVPCFKIHENKDYFAMLDLAQFTQGHTIAIPKAHFETIWDIPDPKGYLSFIQEIGRNFKKLGFLYVDTMSFGRMVRHCHVHIVPHNNDNVDWHRALSVIGTYQHDPSRHLTNEIGEKLAKMFAF